VPAEVQTAVLPGAVRGLSAGRQAAGAALLAVGLPLLVALLGPTRRPGQLATPVLLVLLLVVIGALVGGLRVALPGALAGALLLNWFFVPPIGTLLVDSPEQATVLVVYLAVAVAVSLVVDRSVRRSAEAARARAEAQALSALAGAALSEQQTLPGVLQQVGRVFGMREVSLLERNGQGWTLLERIDTGCPVVDGEAELEVLSGPELALVVRGPELFAADRRVLTSFADAAATALEGRRLSERATNAAQLEAADRMRTALLAAVGHDLRTPLAGVKAAVSSLRQREVRWTPAETAELLDTIEVSADRLQHLVTNLLDASRLQAGVVTLVLEPVSLEEVVGRALLGLPDSERVHLDIADALPDLWVDVGLAERVLANVVENALRHSPGGLMVTIRGKARAGDGNGRASAAVCEVVDHGPGVPESQWSSVFGPFQRLTDRQPGGLGLGLAVARGFAEAMGATLTPAHTPGGGLTMRLTLPVVADDPIRDEPG